MELSLFDFELKENTEPEDDTRITLMNLYFSSLEKARFNELCKQGMLTYYGEKAKEANAVDFLLEHLELTIGGKFVPAPAPNNAEIIAALEKVKAEITKIEQAINGKSNS